jgi:hypothetical protein
MEKGRGGKGKGDDRGKGDERGKGMGMSHCARCVPIVLIVSSSRRGVLVAWGRPRRMRCSRCTGGVLVSGVSSSHGGVLIARGCSHRAGVFLVARGCFLVRSGVLVARG